MRLLMSVGSDGGLDVAYHVVYRSTGKEANISTICDE